MYNKWLFVSDISEETNFSLSPLHIPTLALCKNRPEVMY